MNEEDIKVLLAQIDVKPDNILIVRKDGWSFKLSDFGLVGSVRGV